MKEGTEDIIVIWIIILFVGVATFTICDAVYKKKMEKEYIRGIEVGKRSCEPHPTDTIPMTGAIIQPWRDKSHLKVDSIVFQYDSIMIIHYNNSEIK